MKAHFIVQTVQGVMIAACGLTIPPKQVQGSRVGVYGERCHDCEKAVKIAWVTIQ